MAILFKSTARPSSNVCRRQRLPLFLASALIAPMGAHAADVVVQPASGSGFVVKDASGANERLRVQESGAVSLPSVVAAPAQSQGLCMSASGQLGPCSGGTGSNTYSAGTGLTLSSTTFAVAPTYQLPQTCKRNELAQWNGTGWECAASSSVTLPGGTVNQTLRYDASNNLVVNSSFLAFAEGGLLAAGDKFGVIPSVGAGARLMWWPAADAFRAGRVSGSQWDPPNIGGLSVAMGADTTASGTSSVAMGNGTLASGNSSVALGGGTTASGDWSLAIGVRTRASQSWSVAMGYETVASGSSSLAMGSRAVADGDSSIALGENVGSGGHSGSFIFGDRSRVTGIVNDQNNQFKVVADGGIVLTLSADGSSNATLNHGDSAWNITSDRNTKTALQPVDPREVLKKVSEMPLSTWRYKSQDVDYRHMGPMAQDFYAAFHLGPSDKSISTVDADGVALAAIQGLNAELAERDHKIATLSSQMDTLAKSKDAEITALRAGLSAQTKRIAALESLAGDVAGLKRQLAALRQPATATVALAQP